MPAPKSRRKAPVGVPVPAGLGSSCLCGQSALSVWATTAPIRLLAGLKEVQEFYASLKPAARQSVLKTTPLSDILPQVVEACDIGLDTAADLAASLLTSDELMASCRAFFEKVLEGEGELIGQGSAQPGLRMSDDLLRDVCKRMDNGTLLDRFGGCVPSTHVVMPTKEGLVRFPNTTQQNPEAAAAMKESAQQSVCRPQHDIHYRPWSDPTELDLYRRMLNCSKILGGVVVVLQRRLHRAMMRACLVRQLAASGSGAPALPRADTWQTWSWGVAPQGQLGLGAVRQADAPTPIPALADERVIQVAAAGKHAFALTTKGVLFGWGSSECAVTGLHDTEPSRVPLPCSAVAVTPSGVPMAVSQVAAGELHTLTVRGGRVYGWGSAWLGQLGNTEAMMGGSGCLLPYDEAQHSQLTNLTPGLTFSPEYLQALGITPSGQGRASDEADAHGTACLAMLTGQPVMFGPEMIPEKRSMTPGEVLTDVVAVAAGGMHSIAATSDGACWVWGSNEAGTLGVTVSEDDLQQPWVQALGCGCCDGKDMVLISVSAPVEVDLDGISEGKVVSVAAGSAINVVLTDLGEVISWGASKKLPWRVDTVFSEGDAGLAVAAGGPYAMAVTQKTGSVWVWSRHHMLEWNMGPEQQLLSRAMVHQAWAPRKVPFLSDVHLISCSSTHGLAATRDGRVYWWPHAAVTTTSNNQLSAVAAQSYEVVTLRGLSVLSLAAGENFAICATGLPVPVDEQQQVAVEEASQGVAQSTTVKQQQ